MGVFARHAIAAGTRVWQVDETMHVCDARALAELAPGDLRFALHGGYLHEPSGQFLWYRDGMQFMNHRPGPGANVGLGKWPPLFEDHCIALRSIAAGEELFEDYTFWSDRRPRIRPLAPPLLQGALPGAFRLSRSARARQGSRLTQGAAGPQASPR